MFFRQGSKCWKFPGEQACDTAISLQTVFQSWGWVGCLLTAWLRQEVQNRGAYLCVFVQGYQDTCREPKWCWREVSQTYWNLSRVCFGLVSFHAVWMDNLDILPLTVSKSLRANHPSSQGTLPKGCDMPLLGVSVTHLCWQEHHGQRGDRSGCAHRCYPQLQHPYGSGNAGYFTCLCHALCCWCSHPDTWGDTNKRGDVVAAAGREGFSSWEGA